MNLQAKSKSYEFCEFNPKLCDEVVKPKPILSSTLGFLTLNLIFAFKIFLSSKIRS